MKSQNPHGRSRTRGAATIRPVSVLLVLISTGLLAASCSASQPSFRQLRALVAAVPVPAGVRAGPLQESIEDGPGFTTTKFREVARQFRTRLSCRQLEYAWTAALQNAGLRYAVVRHRRSDFGSDLEVVTLTAPGRVHWAITLGDGMSQCATPSVEAYADPS